MKIRGTTIATPIKPEVAVVKCQNLTEEQKAQARANIGAANDAEMVDLRRDYSGNVHETASQAVMTDIDDLHNNLDNLSQEFHSRLGNMETALDSTKLLVIILDPQHPVVSHTPAEMLEAVNQGRTVVLFSGNESGGCYYSLNSISATDATFTSETEHPGVRFCFVMEDGSYATGDYACANEMEFRELYGLVDRLEGTVGDIETALDSILVIQNQLIGGDA